MISVTLRVASAQCRYCERVTEIVSSLCLEDGSRNVEFSIADLTNFPALLKIISDVGTSRPNLGKIGQRLSETDGHDCASNGCVHCDAIFERRYENYIRYAEKDFTVLMRKANEGWRELMDALIASEGGNLGS